MIGPGERSIFLNAELLLRTMSGEVEDLLLMKVGKKGPMCFIFLSLISVTRDFPMLLLSLCPKEECLAFRSAKIYTGVRLRSKEL